VNSAARLSECVQWHALARFHANVEFGWIANTITAKQSFSL